MRATMKRQFESLESRRMMIADADTVIELWPGPMHSDPYFIRTLDDGRLVFEATTPDGQAFFSTDGTAEGTVPYDINDLPVVPTPEEPPAIQQGVRIVGSNSAVLDAIYVEPGGFEYSYESVPFYYEPSASSLPQLENHGMVGDQMLVHFAEPIDVQGLSRWYLASGDHSTWTELDSPHLTAEKELSGYCDCTVAVVGGESIYIVRDFGAGLYDIIRSDGEANVATELGDNGIVITDSAIYVATAAEGLQLTTAGYEKFFDVSRFEFPTTITGVSALDVIAFGITDPVYGSRVVGVDGEVIIPTEVLPYPGGEPAFGPYRVYGDGVLTDGYQLFSVPAITTANRWITVHGSSPKIAISEFVDFDHGRELVIRDIKAGDANLDGFFDSADLVALMALGEYEDDIVGNSHHLTGDFNGDGEFDSSDLVEALALGWYR